MVFVYYLLLVWSGKMQQIILGHNMKQEKQTRFRQTDDDNNRNVSSMLFNIGAFGLSLYSVVGE